MCDTDSECNNEKIDGCLVTCSNANCWNTSFTNSVVTCLESACYNTNFENCFVEVAAGECTSCEFTASTVELYDSLCESCKFNYSAVKTDGPFSLWAFTKAAFSRCSCCDDASTVSYCPDDVPSCKDTETFCSKRRFGQTCMEWGNPVCK